MSLVLHFQLGYGLPSPSASSPSGAGFYRGGGVFGATSPSPSSATAPPQYHFNGLRILLADSDDTSREVTRKLLERLGCQVLPVPSAARCLSLTFALLKTPGFTPGARVAVISPNNPMILEAHNAILAAGGIINPLK